MRIGVACADATLRSGANRFCIARRDSDHDGRPNEVQVAGRRARPLKARAGADPQSIDSGGCGLFRRRAEWTEMRAVMVGAGDQYHAFQTGCHTPDSADQIDQHVKVDPGAARVVGRLRAERGELQ